MNKHEFLKLGLKLTGPTGQAASITLNGMDISHALTGLDLHIAVGEVNTATLRVLLDDIEVDAETLAVLEAHVADRRESSHPAETTTLASTRRTYAA